MYKKLAARGNNADGDYVSTGTAMNANKAYNVTLIIDLDNHMGTLNVSGKTVQIDDIDVSSINSVRFTTSNPAARNLLVQNLRVGISEGVVVPYETIVTTEATSQLTQTDASYFSFDPAKGTITGYTGSDTEIVIPSSIDGVAVKAIGDYAFLGCSSLTSIDIPAGVTSIGSGAFEGCSSLTSIDIPAGVTSIRARAFYGCSSLTSIDIPVGVTSIGYGAFYWCSSLTSIDIPAGVTSIEICTFYGCSSLTSIDIPAGVTSIEICTFYGCSSLTSIDIPAGVTSIGSSAFKGCSSLTNITLPQGLTSIGGGVFEGCSALTSIDIPKGVNAVTSLMFSGCTALASVNISEVDSIRPGAFKDCSSLKSITIPESVKKVSATAFKGCDNLKTVFCYQGSSADKAELYGSDCQIEYIGVSSYTLTEATPKKENDSPVWKSLVFGQSSLGIFSPDNVSSYVSDNANGTVTVSSWNGCGKVTGDHDGIAYYYTRVNPEDNFSISADIYVRGYLGTHPDSTANNCFYNIDEERSGQEAFGIMARDVIPLDAKEGLGDNNGITVYASNAETDEYGEPIGMRSGDVFASNIAIAGGYSGVAWPKDATAASYYKYASRNRINLVARTGVNSIDGFGNRIEPKPISTAFPLAGIHSKSTSEKANGDKSDETQVGDSYRITLERINILDDTKSGTIRRGLKATCKYLGPDRERADSEETMTAYLDDEEVDDIFSVQNDEDAYVGFFAARWAVIDVSNINFEVIDPSKDKVYKISDIADEEVSETTTDEATTETTTETPAEGANIYMSVPSSAKAGNEFTVNIHLKDAAELAGGRMIIEYDSSLMEPVSYLAGDALTRNNLSPTVNLSYDKDKIIVIFYSTDNYDLNGDLLSLTFKALALGDAPVSVSNKSFSDSDTKDVVLSASGAKIKISAQLLGDVNDDGIINYKDSILVVRSEARTYELTDAQKAAGDVNNDGEVNYKDAILIARHAAGTYNF